MAGKKSLRANLSAEAYEGWQWFAAEADSNLSALLEGMGLTFAEWRRSGRGVPAGVQALVEWQQARRRAQEVAASRLRRDPEREAQEPA